MRNHLPCITVCALTLKGWNVCFVQGVPTPGSRAKKREVEVSEANRAHMRNNRIFYPSDLQTLLPFGKWLQRHVDQLRATGFLIREDVVKLSAPLSKFMASYNNLWAYAACCRCNTTHPSSHATCDSGVSLLESEFVRGSIDLAILEAKYLVSFGLLNVVVIKVNWLEYLDQGRHYIKKDYHGFWRALYSVKDDLQRRNRFVLPSNALHVFFVDDKEEVGRMVVILHKPRNQRVVGHVDQGFLGVGWKKLALETPLDFIEQQLGLLHKVIEIVPNEQVDEINANL